jgi:hypothetical protein
MLNAKLFCVVLQVICACFLQLDEGSRQMVSTSCCEYASRAAAATAAAAAAQQQ